MAIKVGLKGYFAEYTTTGAKERLSLKNIFQNRVVSMKAKVSVAVEGGSSDVFSIYEKLGGENGHDFESVKSIDGQITSRDLTGPNEEMYLDISAIPSGSIKFGITIENI